MWGPRWAGGFFCPFAPPPRHRAKANLCNYDTDSVKRPVYGRFATYLYIVRVLFADRPCVAVCFCAMA